MGECDPMGEHEVRPYDDDDNDAGVMGGWVDAIRWANTRFAPTMMTITTRM